MYDVLYDLHFGHRLRTALERYATPRSSHPGQCRSPPTRPTRHQ
ncbi:hypothetical protein [Streptomyces sp. NPDC050504]